MKRIIFILPLFCLLLLATAPAPKTEATGISVIDDAGREVALPAPPERIVSLSPANTEMLYAIGAGGQIVGVTNFCNYPPEALEKPQVGGYSEINIEMVAGLAPDLVIADSLHLSDIVPALENLGVNVMIITARDIDGVYTSLGILGRAIGREEATSSLLASLREEQARVTTAIGNQPKLRVFWELSADLWTAGPGSFVDDLLNTAGGINIAADSDSAWAQLSAEVVIEKNPQVIFLADHPFGENLQTVEQRPGWDTLDAVVNGRVIEIVDIDPVSRPGPRVIEALSFIAESLHPGIFE